MLKQLYGKVGQTIHSPYATSFLSIMFFLEAIIFVPADPLLLIYCMENRKRAFYYASIATISSVIGGLVAYTIGYAFWEALGQHIVYHTFSPEKVTHVLEQFKTNQSWVILLTGFTPIPFKLVTYCSGFCKSPLIPFIIFSTIVRGGRFFIVASIFTIWGAKIKEYIDRYFYHLVILFATVVTIVALWYLL